MAHDDVIAADALSQLATTLQDLGYKAKIDRTHNLIVTAAGGLTTTLTPVEGAGVQIRCLVTNLDQVPSLKMINDANAKWRFLKFYVDDDDDLTMESDYLYKEEFVSPDLLADMMAMWESFTVVLRELLGPGDSEGRSLTLRK